MSDLIVRADYYNDGSIIPISINYNNKTYIIDNIIKRTKLDKLQYIFVCKSNNLEVNLSYINNKWNVIKIE